MHYNSAMIFSLYLLSMKPPIRRFKLTSIKTIFSYTNFPIKAYEYAEQEIKNKTTSIKSKHCTFDYNLT